MPHFCFPLVLKWSQEWEIFYREMKDVQAIYWTSWVWIAIRQHLVAFKIQIYTIKSKYRFTQLKVSSSDTFMNITVTNYSCRSCTRMSVRKNFFTPIVPFWWYLQLVIITVGRQVNSDLWGPFPGFSRYSVLRWFIIPFFLGRPGTVQLDWGHRCWFFSQEQPWGINFPTCDSTTR